MIQAIEPGIGPTDERPSLRTTQSSGPGFSQALRTAAGPGRITVRFGAEDDRLPSSPRARQSYGTRTDAPRKTPLREQGRTAPESLPSTANRAGQPYLKRTEPQPTPLSEAARDPSEAAQALQMSEDALPGDQDDTLDDTPPIAAQVGLAAYLLGVHGNDEAALAEAQGQALPGSSQAQALAQAGRGVTDVRAATLQPTDPAQLTEEIELGNPGRPGAFDPSEAARTLEARAAAERQQIALQGAQARNELITRLIATGDAERAGTATGGAAEQGAGEALRQHLHLQGLLARTARDRAFEPAAGPSQTNTVLGLTPPTNSVDLTQVFETPGDEAVRQRVLEKVAGEARWLLSNDRQEVTFRLHPEHLGSLQLKVQHRDGQYRVELLVENQAARHLLESSLQDLRNRLASEHPGGEFLFNVDVRQGQDQPGLYARPQHDGPALGLRPEALEEAPAPGLARRVIGQGSLNIYV